MAPFAPFEPRPSLAVAVSGGPDSLALAFLAAAWAAKRRGRIVALTVDHGLRKDSAGEARAVGRWLRDAGVAHHILTWTGPKPRTGIQAAARTARYRLLSEWCRRKGILHLLVAHTRDDQAETFLLRLDRGSGVGGLAAMSGISEEPDLRILRPLLILPKARLIATLQAGKQGWIEDPSNKNLGFARVEVRQFLSEFGGIAVLASRIARSAGELGLARRARERIVAKFLARAAAVDPSGFVELDGAMVNAAPADIAADSVQRCLLCVSGAGYPPRGEKLESLCADLRASPAAETFARTLAGCRIVRQPSVEDGGSILICREEARAATAAIAPPGNSFLWDGRFKIVRSDRGGATWLGPLGYEGWREIVQAAPTLRESAIPLPARFSLPALWDSKGVVAVPHLGYRRAKLRRGDGLCRVVWQPANSLTRAGFSVA
ncbi:MAG: tRNA lysidine(34) synthetase TilS [Alphaproteobacteria bacterium]